MHLKLKQRIDNFFSFLSFQDEIDENDQNIWDTDYSHYTLLSEAEPTDPPSLDALPNRAVNG